MSGHETDAYKQAKIDAMTDGMNLLRVETDRFRAQVRALKTQLVQANATTSDLRTANKALLEALGARPNHAE